MASITITPQNPGTISNAPTGTVLSTSLPGTVLVQRTSDNSVNMTPTVQTYTGTSDAVTFANPLNVAIFNSTAPDAATLATPAATDAGKVLILINYNTAATTVTTAQNKVVTGSASTWDTLTSPAHSGAMAILVASNGFWNTNPLGLGAWTLSEV